MKNIKSIFNSKLFYISVIINVVYISFTILWLPLILKAVKITNVDLLIVASFIPLVIEIIISFIYSIQKNKIDGLLFVFNFIVFIIICISVLVVVFLDTNIKNFVFPNLVEIFTFMIHVCVFGVCYSLICSGGGICIYTIFKHIKRLKKVKE